MSSIRKMILVDAEHVGMMRKFGGPRTEEATSPTTYEDGVISDLPKTLQSKGTALVRFFQRNNIGYDSTNRLTYNGKAVPGSNYRDLLSDLVRYRDRPPPTGFESLARILKDVNVGRELITNLERYAYINDMSDNEHIECSEKRRVGRAYVGVVNRKRSVGITTGLGCDRKRSVPSEAKKWSAF